MYRYRDKRKKRHSYIRRENKAINTLRTDDADLHFYITTVQDG